MPTGAQRFTRQAIERQHAKTEDHPTGKVTAVTSGVATVLFLGSSKQLPHLAAYTPAVNDIVVLIRVGGDWAILGPLAGFPS